ncbi:dihydroxyacetone kinase subunit DhaK [Nesterenkonia sp. F]|uniref:dihydroxyacetone kinase subunit DhaK n=1 Tax=Nesterenkonia sp. F TaxID=795955 RepID=UPI000255D09D|nr:dihydroxyacetone kinase subunit DhaK [Nesterenkonia sp. F]
MAHFHPSRDQLVPEVLEALLRTAAVERLETSEGVDVLVRADHDPAAGVAVVSGGGSGHEPAHAGYLGEGMLAAAVPGSLFASPPVSAVLEAIRAVTGPAGCLLVIKNYTGDRLNFGLAAERAREEGLDVRTVLIRDDVALPDIEQPRGLAGTVLVHKVAGHLAAQGGSLDDVAAAAERTGAGIRTMALALTPATLPGAERDASRGAELGLGIHNEPGARSAEVSGADDAMALVLEALDARSLADEHGGRGLVAVLNDLGGCSPQEGLVLARELLGQLGVRPLARLIGPAPLMTSLDMHGFSVTLAPATEELLAAVDAPTTAPGWAPATTPGEPRTRPAGESTAEAGDPAPTTEDGRVEQAVRSGAAALTAATEELDALDRAAGDADAGTTFAAGARAVDELIGSGELGFADPAAAVRRIARSLETAMGGSSGVLLAICSTAVARALEDGRSWPEAFQAGIAAMQHHGGAVEGDRTMLDALLPAQRALAGGGGLPEAARAAGQGAEATAALTAKAGRAAYVPEAATAGAQDAGAVAVARFLDALASALR